MALSYQAPASSLTINSSGEIIMPNGWTWIAEEVSDMLCHFGVHRAGGYREKIFSIALHTSSSSCKGKLYTCDL
jgi:hypothetical protein